MALKIIDHGTPDYNDMVKLRSAILRKPLGIDFAPEELEREKDDILICYFDDKKIEGCCLLTQSNPKEARLRQMAVLSGFAKTWYWQGIDAVCREHCARPPVYQNLHACARDSNGIL